MNVDRLLPHTVSWRALVSENSREGNVYADAITLRARKEERVIEATGPGGLERHQANTIFVREDVALGDLIDGEVVQGRDSGVRLSGDTILYRLVTE